MIWNAVTVDLMTPEAYDHEESESIGDTPGDLAAEENWRQLSASDDVWGAPSTPPPPLSTPAPEFLNTHEMGWEFFEALILNIARDHEGAYEVRKYGKSGQTQHGLDAVGFFETGVTVYQDKRWQVFTSADLTAAVEKYTSGRRPFNANRMVVAVASLVDDTRVIERLDQLRVQHAPMEINLWDRRHISDMLRSEFRIVTKFFGRASAQAFCIDVVPASDPPDEASITADAVLRGPIASLDLGEQIRRAESLLETEPITSAQIFVEVGEKLRRAGFVPHGALVRDQAARALHRAGRQVEAALLRIDLGWEHTQAGNTGSARTQLHELHGLPDAESLPPVIVRCGNALDATVAYLMDHRVSLDVVAAAVDSLEVGDPHHLDAVLLLVEEADANQRLDIVSDRDELVEQLAASLPSDHQGQLVAARLRMAMADSSGTWDQLSSTAREIYPPRVCAFISARHARFLTLGPAPAAANARWSDAIERACLERLYDDAANWLYSQRAMRMENGLPLGSDPNEAHRHALALQAAGHGTVLRDASGARERALNHMLDREWPDALEALQRYLWHAVVTADWRGEIEAHDLLGDVFRDVGRPDYAVRHYVFAGKAKKLEELVDAFGERRIDFPASLWGTRAWERVAALAFATAAEDLLSDEDAQAWCAVAFGEFADRAHQPVFGAPDVWLSSVKAFGHLAGMSSEADARHFLTMAQDWIPRTPHTYRFTDKEHALALAHIAHCHASVRREATDQMLSALLADQQMAEIILLHGQDLMREDPTHIAETLGQAAGENIFAAIALVVSGASTDPCIPLARRQLEHFLEPQVHIPGQVGFGMNLNPAALLISTLPDEDRSVFARAMIGRAGDTQDATSNRSAALRTFVNIGKGLPQASRIELFPLAMRFARGEEANSAVDALFTGMNDALNRFRVSIGGDPIEAAGLLAAATLAVSTEDVTDVENSAIRLVYGADDSELNTIAHALAQLPMEGRMLPAGLLVAHPNRWLRAAAAAIWAQRPSEPLDVGLLLARDGSRNVRQTLATSLAPIERHEEVRRILEEDPRRSIRRIVAVP